MNKLTPSTEISTYSFPVTGNEVRTVMIDDTIWFVAADVTDILEIGRTHDAVRGLDDDEKGTESIRTPGGDQWVSVINESGLYSLVLRSRKPQAKAFKKWVTSEVLPTIRKTGSYAVTELQLPQTFSEALRALADTHEAKELEKKRAEAAEHRVLELEPAAEMADLYAAADTLKEVRSFARDIQQLGLNKGIKILQQDVYDYLGKIGLIIRGNTAEKNQATAKAITNGWALNSTHLYERSDGTFEKKSYGKLTAKGEQYAMTRAAKSLNSYGTLNVAEIKKILVSQ